MHVLLTRAGDEASEFGKRLEQLGYRISVAPLLSIEHLPVSAQAVSGANALIATSRNSLRAVAASGISLPRSLPVFAVGQATASVARDLGFSHVFTGTGGAKDLVPVIQDNAAPGAHLVQLAGDTLAFDTAGALEHLGFTVRVVTCYRSVPARTLPPNVIDGLSRGNIDAVVLLSPRTAATFTELTNNIESLAGRQAALSCVCLSEAVASALKTGSKDSSLLTIDVAARPDLDEIIALLSRRDAKFRAQ